MHKSVSAFDRPRNNTRAKPSIVLDGAGFCLSKAAKHFRLHISPILLSHGLQLGQELFLAQLWREDGLLQSELARRLQNDKSTISITVKRLAASGFVKVCIDRDDRRTSRVYLTSLGSGVQSSIESAWQEAELEITKALGVRGRHILVKQLSRLGSFHQAQASGCGV